MRSRVARALLAVLLSFGIAACAGDGQSGPEGGQELPGGPNGDDRGAGGDGY